MTIHEFAYSAALEHKYGCVLVRFPDLPEAVTVGDDEVDALIEARDCLEEAVAGRIARGDDIPRPSPTEHGQHRVYLAALTAAKAALYLAMRNAGVNKVQLARRLGCDEKEVRRLLDPKLKTRLPRLEEAIAVLDGVVEVRLVIPDAPQAAHSDVRKTGAPRMQRAARSLARERRKLHA